MLSGSRLEMGEGGTEECGDETGEADASVAPSSPREELGIGEFYA